MKGIKTILFVVVVRFGDPCESPRALLFTAAPGSILLLLLMVCDSCESLEPVGAPYVVWPIAIWGTFK